MFRRQSYGWPLLSMLSRAQEDSWEVGIASHIDPGILTLLLQDQVGVLQVKHEGKWVNVKPIQGALVINVGDLLQLLSNDKYTSVEHRAYANPWHEPRVSVVVFFNPSMMENLYGPIPEIVSPEEPAQPSNYSNEQLERELFLASSVQDFNQGIHLQMILAC
ncbi:hypothetical protein SOVF_090750 [Spinacia oleracea]|nr:hypothetical protein SOVF_090750 [Spinacia oleracea]